MVGGLVDPLDGFAEFAEARGRTLVRMAYVLTGDKSTAEDLVQTALMKAAIRWRRITAGGDPEAYVRRIIVNDHVSWWRRLGRRETLVAGAQDHAGSDGADDVVRRIDLAAALASLAPRQRAVVMLRFYADLSEAETAAAMGCAIGTVKSQTSDALARLRQLLPALTDVDVATEASK